MKPHRAFNGALLRKLPREKNRPQTSDEDIVVRFPSMKGLRILCLWKMLSDLRKPTNTVRISETA